MVDNGSGDGSAELVSQMGESFPAPLRLVANSVNRGFCAANNQGFAATRSELVALLNNDAEADPGWLAALEAAIMRADDIGMAASKILVWEDGQGKIWISYNSPEYFRERHGLPQELLQNVALVETLAAKGGE